MSCSDSRVSPEHCFDEAHGGDLFVARGAVKAVIDAVNDHKDIPGHIQLLASAIAPAVRAVSDKSSNRLMNVTRMNVIMTVERVRNKAPVLDFYHDQKRIRSAGGVYHLDTEKVELVA